MHRLERLTLFTGTRVAHYQSETAIRIVRRCAEEKKRGKPQCALSHTVAAASSFSLVSCFALSLSLSDFASLLTRPCASKHIAISLCVRTCTTEKERKKENGSLGNIKRRRLFALLRFIFIPSLSFMLALRAVFSAVKSTSMAQFPQLDMYVDTGIVEPESDFHTNNFHE